MPVLRGMAPYEQAGIGRKMDDKSLRQHVVKLLSGEGAHVDFKRAIARVYPKFRGARVDGAPHTLWELVEHIRLAQWDILEFSGNSKHVSPEWPEGYWPKGAEPPSEKAWEASIRQFLREREAMKKLVLNPKTNLLAKIAHGKGQTILREALLAADHTAYHTGQIVLVRNLLGIWEKD
jgi:hypothetical protein